MPQQDEKKGTFGKSRLGMAKKYIYPFSRRRMMVVGIAGSIAVLLLFLFNAVVQNGSLFSQGPVSVNHAGFETQCEKCHSGFSEIGDVNCSLCHEKANDKRGVYTYSSHYLYTSAIHGRVTASHSQYAGKEITCAACHPEHKGRTAIITQVSDDKCTRCHDYGSFNTNHPEFEFARHQKPDDSTLTFQHIVHTKEVLKKIGSLYVEQACLYCHHAQPGGKNFQPISFELHCAECHQPVGLKTASLAVREPNVPTIPGVETLEMIQQRGAPGSSWAFSTNPNEFKIRPTGEVVKSPVYHKDPWILENLSLIRSLLYDDLGLSELVKSMGKTPWNGAAVLYYREALRTLQQSVTPLRGRPEPEVQTDLAHIDSLLRVAQSRLGVDPTLLSDSSFSSDKIPENPNLTHAQKKEFEDFALKVAQPCRLCHMVEHSAVLRVNADQRILSRAEFNHRAHILQRRCLDCHTDISIQDIPINDLLSSGPISKGSATKDRSAVQNIPRIETCFQCHNKGEASNNCVACHFMHPDKEKLSNLKLFVENN